jgi:hypothetical protein
LKSRLHRARVALREMLVGVLDARETEPCRELAQQLSRDESSGPGLALTDQETRP